MSKRLVTLLGAIGLCVCACNERVEYSSYYAVCTPESFSSVCATTNARTVCIDNRIAIQDCDENQICLNGICQVNVANACQSESFVSTCADDNHKYICNLQNKIERELCPAGTRCEEGNCTVIVDNSCDETDYISECTDDTHYTVCHDNIVVIEACLSGSFCQGGSCITNDSCDEDGYISECADDKHYTVCRNGVKDSEACEGEAVCIKGGCSTETECDKASFVSECQGTKQFTFCTEEGKISSADCPLNTECRQGECREITSNTCDSDKYVNSCDGSKRLACNNGEIAEYDCANDELVCYQGECRAVGTVECDTHFVNKCIGDTFLYCSGEHLGVVSTDNCKKLYHNLGICATVNGVTGCYRTCSEKDVQEHATSICEPGKPNYLVTGGECVQTADNQYVFVVPQDTEATRCDTDETIICKDGGCVKDDRLRTSCNPQTDVKTCDGDRLYYCDDGGEYRVRSCYGKCFAINGVTDCYKPCVNEGDYYYEEDDDADNDKAIKFECTQTDSGLYYVPSEVECFSIIDSLDKMLFGSNGFAYSGDICISQKSNSDSDSCDGNIAKNVVHTSVKDSNGEWVPTAVEIPTDCGSQTCVVHNGEAFCADPCTAEDVQNEQKKNTCGFYELEQEELEYISQSYSCVQVGDDYYWKSTGAEECPHGCAADQSCHWVHPFEGTTACASYMDEIDFLCRDNVFLSCDYRNDVAAYDCGDRVCSSRGRLGCFDTCDEADAGKMTHTCSDDNHSTHLVCTGYAMIDYIEKCENGCNAETGLCVLEPGAPDTELVCYLDDWEDYFCRPKCTIEEIDSFIGVCNDGVRTGWLCNGDYWDYFSSLACEYGCNDDNTSCKE